MAHVRRPEGRFTVGFARPGQVLRPPIAPARASAAGFAPAVPTGKRSSCEPAPTNGRATCCKNNGMDLVDWIGQVPSFREKRTSGERFPLSLPVRSIKVRAQSPAEPAPQRGRHRHGEWFDRSRLEQPWGFATSPPSWTRSRRALSQAAKGRSQSWLRRRTRSRSSAPQLPSRCLPPSSQIRWRAPVLPGGGYSAVPLGTRPAVPLSLRTSSQSGLRPCRLLASVTGRRRRCGTHRPPLLVAVRP